VRNADHIAVLDHGRVIEAGTHARLSRATPPPLSLAPSPNSLA
jgi:ABC-type multidrug transport system fused ATPase/permease subunit